MPAVVEDEPGKDWNALGLRIRRPLFVTKFQDTAHGMTKGVGRTLTAPKIAGVPVKVPKATGDTVKREPGMAI
jgi:hypothetical protein